MWVVGNAAQVLKGGGLILCVPVMFPCAPLARVDGAQNSSGAPPQGSCCGVPGDLEIGPTGGKITVLLVVQEAHAAAHFLGAGWECINYILSTASLGRIPCLRESVQRYPSVLVPR